MKKQQSVESVVTENCERRGHLYPLEVFQSEENMFSVNVTTQMIRPVGPNLPTNRSKLCNYRHPTSYRLHRYIHVLG